MILNSVVNSIEFIIILCYLLLHVQNQNYSFSFIFLIQQVLILLPYLWEHNSSCTSSEIHASLTDAPDSL